MAKRGRLEEELRYRLRTRKLEKCGGGVGGCISPGFGYLIDNDEKIFVKTNETLYARVMFDGELESLRQIEATRTIRVPRPICVIPDIKDDHDHGGNSHTRETAIVMEFLHLDRLNDDCAVSLGRNLANLHDYNNKMLRFKKRAGRWIGGQQPSVKAISEQLRSSLTRRRNSNNDDRNRGEESEGEDDEEENRFTKHNLRVNGSNLSNSNCVYSPLSSSSATTAALEVEQAANRMQQQQLDPSTTINTQQQVDGPYPSRFVPEPNAEEITQFGFNVPTSCGSIPQINEWHDDWVSFYARNRLDKAIRELLSNHGDRELHQQWSHLQLKVDKFFSDFDTTNMGGSNEDDDNNGTNRIVPALLHGDLWSGNVAQLVDGSQGVIWDPASFYGHSEYDFGIARMFGGIPRAFEKGYFEIMPKKKLFEKRNKLYQFFHHLNHWEHFGSGYRSSSLKLIKDLNALV